MTMNRIFGIFLLSLLITGCRHHDIIEVFPLDKYDQIISHWIKPTDKDYDKPLMGSVAQQQRVASFYKHYFGKSSPWNADYVNKIINAPKPDDLISIEKSLFTLFNNQKNKSQKELGYGENFAPYSENWINTIASNINIIQFENIKYNPNNRAIAIDNLAARVLPTEDPFYYHHKIAGQGFPFDNLQISALWAGTPIYILGQTKDHAWSLVITPDYIGWVKSLGFARVDKAFIKTWVSSAIKKFAAITQTKTSIVDTDGVFRFSAYVGAVFPAVSNSQSLKIMIPVADNTQHAKINYAFISSEKASLLPMAPTPHHFSNIMNTLLNRPYGWGNLYFFNDCSSELKNLFAPFGVWLPRHSSDQMYVGKMTNLTEETSQQRLQYLMEKGEPFTTLVYVGGHVLLFIGNYPNPNASNHALMPLTFQNMWGLSPKPAKRRAVVGKSVLFPLLESYPEDRSLISQANKKVFQITQLDHPSSNLQKLELIDLKDLMYP